IAQYDRNASLACLKRSPSKGLIETCGTLRCELAQVLEKCQRRFAAAHRPQAAAYGHLLRVVRESRDSHAVESAQCNIANGSGDLPGKIKLAGLAERHRFARVEENADRQLALFLVKLKEQSFEPAVEIPVQVTKIVAGNVVSVIRELNRLPARPAAALALG